MRAPFAIAALAVLVAGCPAVQDPASAPPETKPMVTIEPAPAEPAVVTVAPVVAGMRRFARMEF